MKNENKSIRETIKNFKDAITIQQKSKLDYLYHQNTINYYKYICLAKLSQMFKLTQNNSTWRLEEDDAVSMSFISWKQQNLEKSQNFL